MLFFSPRVIFSNTLKGPSGLQTIKGQLNSLQQKTAEIQQNNFCYLYLLGWSYDLTLLDELDYSPHYRVY